MKRKKLVALLLAAAMAVSMLGGCGSDDGKSEDASNAAETGETEPDKEEAKDESGEKSADSGSGWKSDPDHEPYEIEIYTNAQGGATYVLGVAFADLINKYSSWLKATAMESPGPDQTASMVLADDNYKEHVMGYMIGVDAILGEDPFTEPNYDLRCLIGYGLVSNVFLTLDENIKTLQDLDGKTVALRTKPNVPAVDIPTKMFEILGIEPKYEYLSFADSATALADGKVDAILSGGMALNAEATEWTQMAALAEVYARNDVYYVSLDEKALFEAKDALNHSLLPGVMTLEPGQYDAKFNDEVTIMADYLCWYVHKDFPEDVQEELLNIYYEHCDEFAEYKDEGKYCTKENMGKIDTPELISDVANKFYEEKGIEVNYRETPYETYVPK
ncbi:TAXI family TRAP transporter solute-binding subunit [Lactonifactor longoviformis]|uniref:TRAP transporter solute receptor, TAXI family n=1 Tax=Lactonifactor longoviformis DSM 17459 TaxID=1122155 RepID=A0A1M5AE27_9CLOT|nr:TAXI family TRAP transporter solute-binding subunit [Lactonifactor longoviformis]SHF28346.1 TRAP transporter solute receptor, TAXI family [Lactonifactor longoviformis DSM 17459]